MVIYSRIAYLIIASAAYFIHRFSASYAMLVVFLLLLFMPMLLFFINLCIKRKIVITARLEASAITINQSAKIQLTIKNPSIVPISCAKIKLKYSNSFSHEVISENLSFCISSCECTRVDLNVKAAHCGIVTIRSAKIVLYDLINITSVSKKYDMNHSITVTPPLHDIPLLNHDTEAYNIEGDRYSEHRSGDDPSQPFDYREYQNGDNVKRINWKLSSRMDKIMVKEASEPIKAIRLILFELVDTTQKKANINERLSIADLSFEVMLSISHKLLAENVSFNLYCHDDNNLVDINYFIENEDIMQTVVQRLFSLDFSKNASSLQSLSYLEKHSAFSQVIYITNYITSDMVELLYSIDAPLTVIYNNPNPIDASSLSTIKKSLQSHEIELLSVTCENVGEIMTAIRL